MKKTLVVLLVSVLVFCFGYAAHAIHETPEDGTKSVTPGADAAKLFSFIKSPRPYTDTMDIWPEKGKYSAPTMPQHGSFVATYVNKPALKSIKGKTEMSDGSVIVHEEYDAKENLAALCVMYKIKGYNPEDGDWFWAKYAPSGYVLESGKPTSCISCHESRKRTDYLFSQDQ